MMSYRNWPKIDLHRHLEGSLRLSTIECLGRGLDLALPYGDKYALRKLFTIVEEDEKSLKQFLTKFTWIRKIISNQEILERITFEAIEDAALDNIIYLELRFNYSALICSGLTSQEILNGITNGINEAKMKYDIEVALICGISRDLPVEHAMATVDFAIQNRHKDVVAIDLMNDERFAPGLFVKPFQRAYEGGLEATAHAGEAGPAQNIIDSVNELHVTRIGHGARILQDELALKLVKEKQILIECCLSSNVQTGAIHAIEEHPILELIENGVPVSINTDDPGVSDITLSGEYSFAEKQFYLNSEILRKILLDSTNYIFKPECAMKLRTEINKYFSA